MKRSAVGGLVLGMALGLAAVSGATGAPSIAQTSRDDITTAYILQQFQSDLYEGQSAVAHQRLTELLTRSPDDNNAKFALGVTEFLEAVEHLGQGLHRYGLRSRYDQGMLGGLTGLPFLRLPVPPNDHPDKATYEALRTVLAEFVVELETADATLSSVTSKNVDLPLNLGLIRLDLDGNGGDPGDQPFWRIFSAVTGDARIDEKAAQQLLVDFDGSDVLWLRAYCNLLMAMGDVVLGYDWHETFDATFQGVFPSAGLPLSGISGEEAIRLRIDELRGKSPDLPAYDNNDPRYQEYWALKHRLDYMGIADLVAFVHLTRWPVVERARTQQALEHLQAMVKFSRASWARIVAETDDNHEWIPSANQHGVLPSMQITAERIAGWKKLLDEFDSILAGKTLIPHWRFDKGMNLRRFLLEPETFDLVLLIQGSAALPYLQDGAKSDPATWGNIMQLFRGDFLRYFLWIN